MDYSEAREAFFSPLVGASRTLEWVSPARRLRDAIEPLATVCFWSEPAYNAYAARGLDFLTGYVWGRGSALGYADAAVIGASFGAFEPGLVAGLVTAGRAACSLEDIRAAKLECSTAALTAVLGDPTEAEGLEDTLARLQAAALGLSPMGRPFFAGLFALPCPQDGWGRLWHVTSVLREHRGDAQLAALVAAGLSGVEANVLTQGGLGWDPLSYIGRHAWDPKVMEAATASLRARGLLDALGLTAKGRELRESLERTTDAAEDAVVTCLGEDLDVIVARLDGWAQRVVDRGWFPPDGHRGASK